MAKGKGSSTKKSGNKKINFKNELSKLFPVENHNIATVKQKIKNSNMDTVKSIAEPIGVEYTNLKETKKAIYKIVERHYVGKLSADAADVNKDGTVDGQDISAVATAASKSKKKTNPVVVDETHVHSEAPSTPPPASPGAQAPPAAAPAPKGNATKSDLSKKELGFNKSALSETWNKSTLTSLAEATFGEVKVESINIRQIAFVHKGGRMPREGYYSI